MAFTWQPLKNYVLNVDQNKKRPNETRKWLKEGKLCLRSQRKRLKTVKYMWVTLSYSILIIFSFPKFKGHVSICCSPKVVLIWTTVSELHDKQGKWFQG